MPWHLMLLPVRHIRGMVIVGCLSEHVQGANQRSGCRRFDQGTQNTADSIPRPKRGIIFISPKYLTMALCRIIWGGGKISLYRTYNFLSLYILVLTGFKSGLPPKQIKKDLPKSPPSTERRNRARLSQCLGGRGENKTVRDRAQTNHDIKLYPSKKLSHYF